jgi:predicted transcriptional regulator
MASSAASRVALMSIHPRYAEAIVAGRKRVEFRKRPLAADIDVVVIYATAPVRAIIGWFTVSETVRGAPEDIWHRLHAVGEISWSDFHAYYSGCSEAVALLVGETQRLAEPVALSELCPRPTTPQSFNYIPGTVLDQVGS